MNGILLSVGSFGHCNLGSGRRRAFDVVRKSASASMAGILARVSSIYLLYREGALPSRVSFSLRWHIKHIGH